MEEQLDFQLSQVDVERMIARPVADVAPPIYDVNEIISRLTREEIFICDHLHELDETDETMNRFLIETAEIKTRDGALGEVALSELTRKYLPRIRQIIPEPLPVKAEQVVLGRSSNGSNNPRPKTVRLRSRQSPSQIFRSR